MARSRRDPAPPSPEPRPRSPSTRPRETLDGRTQALYYLPPAMQHTLRILAAERRVSASSLVEAAVARYLRRLGRWDE